VSFWAHLNETGLFELRLEHRRELEKPKIVSGDTALHLQHGAIHHQNFSYCDFWAGVHAGKVFVCLWRQLRNHHYCHSSGIAGHGELALTVIDLSVLAEFAEFEVFALCFANCFEVGIDHSLTILDQFVSKLEVNEAMAQFHFCENEL
jgi:hypothetical protein